MVITTTVTLGLFVISLPAFGQNQTGQQQQTEKPLPVLLIHGYAEDVRHMEKMGGYAQNRWHPVLYSNFQRF